MQILPLLLCYIIELFKGTTEQMFEAEMEEHLAVKHGSFQVFSLQIIKQLYKKLLHNFRGCDIILVLRKNMVLLNNAGSPLPALQECPPFISS